MTISSRFKDNNIIDKDLYNYNNALEIPDVAGLNGSFRCRVVNQFGAEFSTAAQLTVFGKHSLFVIPATKFCTLLALSTEYPCLQWDCNNAEIRLLPAASLIGCASCTPLEVI